MLDAALRYASFGIPVFPCWHIANGRCGCGNPECASPGKHPLTVHGVKDATTDPTIIRSWWGRAPEPNIGGATGPSFTVVDEDEPGALLATGIDIPNAPAQRTGRGCHVVFKANGYTVPNSSKFAPGLDARGTGGYVMLAPSMHVSGRRYAWIAGHGLEDVVIPELPAALAELLVRRGSQNSNGETQGHDLFGRLKLEQLLHELETMPQTDGGWRPRMLQIVGSLIGRRVPDDIIRAICRRATWTNAGYTHDDTDAWVTDCIRSTRQRWDMPEPDEATFGKVDGEPARAAEPGDLCLTPTEWAARDIPPEDLLLGSLFSTTTRSQFSADTGLGKTMFGLAVGFAMGLGADFLHWRGHRPARVLILDGEMPGELIKARLAAAASWFQAENPEGLFLLSREDVPDMPPLDTPEGASWLLDFIEKLGGVDFAIFDNIAALTTGCLKEEDGAQATKNLQRDLTARRIGQLWLHHTGHDTSRGYGAKLREWWLDTAMVAEKLDRPDADVAFTLKFPKCRRRTPDNRADFEEVEVTLAQGQWTTGAAGLAGGSRRKLPDSARLCLDALQKAVADLGRSPPYSSATAGVACAVKLEDWRSIFNLMAPYAEDDTRRKTWRRGTERLVADRVIAKWGDWVWLP